MAGNTINSSFTILSSAFCAYDIGQTWTYNYSTSAQTFTTPCDGTYKLEVWGGAGTTVGSGTGGKGGYSYGNISLNTNDALTINVGSNSNHASGVSTTNYSGDVDAYGNEHSGHWTVGSGGHRTYIAKSSTMLICAGGGGGGYYAYDSVDGWFVSQGGTGGGTSGGSAATLQGSPGNSTGGSQTAAGSQAGSFYKAGGRGGGYYPGGNGGVTYSTRAYGAGAGGGSGYIGGVTNGSMQNGVRSGNGYAKITLVTISN